MPSSADDCNTRSRVQVEEYRENSLSTSRSNLRGAGGPIAYPTGNCARIGAWRSSAQETESFVGERSIRSRVKVLPNWRKTGHLTIRISTRYRKGQRAVSASP